jgi:hypothetical protein
MESSLKEYLRERFYGLCKDTVTLDRGDFVITSNLLWEEGNAYTIKDIDIEFISDNKQSLEVFSLIKESLDEWYLIDYIVDSKEYQKKAGALDLYCEELNKYEVDLLEDLGIYDD